VEASDTLTTELKGKKMKKPLTAALFSCIATLSLVGIFAFQGPTQKLGVVDVSDVAEKSKMGQREKKAFEDLRTRLSGLLQFVSMNKVLKRDEANKLVELWRMEKPTAEQTKELEQIKTTAQKNSDELRRLISILNPTADDQAKIRELSALAQNTEDMLPQLDSLLGQAMQAQASSKQQVVLDKARAAVKKVGARDGYTVVYESGFAPYGANDITDAALKVMDTDNP
jgi:Skp family chaperone for outer membrane proteins